MKFKKYDTTVHNKIKQVSHQDLVGLKRTGADELVDINDIRLPKHIAMSYPSQKKIKEYTERYIKLGYLDKPIVVYPETNEIGKPNKLILVNGYIRYLIAREYNFDYIPVKYQYEYI